MNKQASERRLRDIGGIVNEYVRMHTSDMFEPNEHTRDQTFCINIDVEEEE